MLVKRTKPFKITFYVPDVLSANSALVKVLSDEQEEYALNNFYLWTEECFPPNLILPFQQLDVLHDPAIRHAMVAIGVLQERNNLTGESNTKRRLAAMEHYGRSIRTLLSRQPDPIESKISISLLTCILFVCLETIHGRHSSALSHLQSGYKLFQEAKENKTLNNTSYASESTFRSLFVRLSCQITDFKSVNCKRLSGLPLASGDNSNHFANLNDARVCLAKIVERVFNELQIWTVSSRDPAPSSSPPGESHDSFHKSLVQELQNVEQWILAFNQYLSHSVSALHTCDSYVLAICSVFLKLRITMICRDLAGEDANTDTDFAHVLNLGEVLFDEYESSLRSQRKSNISGWSDAQLACPLHRLFNDKFSKEPTGSAPVPRPNGVGLFFFLGAFCSLVVASMCSQELVVRQKAHEVVAKVCRCGRGWDTSLTVHIARLISPTVDATEWHGSKSCQTETDFDLQLFDSVISPEMVQLLALVQAFNEL